MLDHVARLDRKTHEIDPGKIGQIRNAFHVLAENMGAEFETKGIGQRRLEDELLLHRLKAALGLAEGAGGLELQRLVAGFPDVGALKEAEQILGVERVEGITRLSRLGRLIVIRSSQ